MPSLPFIVYEATESIISIFTFLLPPIFSDCQILVITLYVNWALSSLKRLVWGGAEANNVKRTERQITQGVLPQMSQLEFEETKILLQVFYVASRN